MYTNDLEKLINKKSFIKLGDVEVPVTPTPRDAEMFLAIVGVKQLDEKSTSKITELMKSIIKRANPQLPDDKIDLLIATNYGTIFSELAILFGFTTREQAEKVRERFSGGEVGFP